MNLLDRAQAFLDTLAEPRPEGPPIIPKHWRMPFFVGLALVSIAVLAAFVWLVVIPSVRAQQSAAVPTQTSAPKP